ncbi:MAG: NUDIX domain-containing protein [Candidatus Aenigmarchaeota archaeon]|nr:NUDIX domain-containing protein [Candidatus Aenigmarchaeota archaeon]
MGKEEFLDYVDDNDNVIDSMSKKEIYEKLLTHRIAHVLVFNREGKMCLQLRGNVKSFAFHWCTTAGGHVQAGESYEEGAKREMTEEVGIDAQLTQKFKDTYVYTFGQYKGIKKFLVTFIATYDGPFNINKNDVKKVKFFTLEEIQKMVDRGEKIHPELLFLLKKYYGII